MNITKKRFNEIIKESIDYVVNSSAPYFADTNTTYNYDTDYDDEDDYNAITLYYNDGSIRNCNPKNMYYFTFGHDFLAINKSDGAIFNNNMKKLCEVDKEEYYRIVNRMKWWAEGYKGTSHKEYADEMAKILNYVKKI